MKSLLLALLLSPLTVLQADDESPGRPRIGSLPAAKILFLLGAERELLRQLETPRRHWRSQWHAEDEAQWYHYPRPAKGDIATGNC